MKTSFKQHFWLFKPLVYISSLSVEMIPNLLKYYFTLVLASTPSCGVLHVILHPSHCFVIVCPGLNEISKICILVFCAVTSSSGRFATSMVSDTEMIPKEIHHHKLKIPRAMHCCSRFSKCITVYNGTKLLWRLRFIWSFQWLHEPITNIVITETRY